MAAVSVPDFSAIHDTKAENHVVRSENGRLSGLLAPTMSLTGHEKDALTVQFSPDGKHVASAGLDKKILIYNVYGDITNSCMLVGHTNAILQIRWSPDGKQLYSVSADESVCIWDVESGKRLKKFLGHMSIVNSCSCGNPAEAGGAITTKSSGLLATGSDDGTTRLWDTRTRKCSLKIEHQYQILSVAMNAVGNQIFAGSLDNTIRVYDMRNGHSEVEVLRGHGDSVTGLDVNTNGTLLLSNSMDQTIRIWDIQPYCSAGKRFVTAISGVAHNFEKKLLRVAWSADEMNCSAGSADRLVYLWDLQALSNRSKASTTGSSQPVLKGRFPGHAGVVNEVAFHPKEPIIASCSSDTKVILGEYL